MTGKFITIEGIDGSGKTTQSQRIASWLEERTGHKSIRTFEPGGWPDGEKLRGYILGHEMSAMTELLMFLADRSEHVNRVILPSLRQGHNVICERWNESTLAYQSGGHELNISQVERIIYACNFPEPDVKILLDVPPETAFKRVKARGNKNDKFEAEGLNLMKRVSESYRRIADSQPQKFIRIPCVNMSEDEVFRAVILRLEAVT
ncbi:MAG: dTMP kinase [Synergistaceae bacterium]|nr:dTMP kinase [Synergistaceae bacterium]